MAPPPGPFFCGGSPTYYCLSVGAVVDGSDEGSSAGVVLLSSEAPAQSPAQILVPLTVPTSLQPIGVFAFA
jgi:hypothetical protein